HTLAFLRTPATQQGGSPRLRAALTLHSILDPWPVFMRELAARSAGADNNIHANQAAVHRRKTAPHVGLTSGVEVFRLLVKQWNPRECADDKGHIKGGVGPFLERMQRERQAYVYRHGFPALG